MPSDDVTDEELKYLDGVMDSTVTATYTAWYFEAWERRIKPILRKLLKERDTQRATIAVLQKWKALTIRQAEEAHEYVLAQINQDLKRQLAAQADQIKDMEDLVGRLRTEVKALGQEKVEVLKANQAQAEEAKELQHEKCEAGEIKDMEDAVRRFVRLRRLSD